MVGQQCRAGARMSNGESSKWSTYLVSFAQKIIRPAHLPGRSIQKVCSRHTHAMDKEQREWLGDRGRSQALDIHLVGGYQCVALRNVVRTDIEIAAAMEGS